MSGFQPFCVRVCLRERTVPIEAHAIRQELMIPLMLQRDTGRWGGVPPALRLYVYGLLF